MGAMTRAAREMMMAVRAAGDEDGNGVGGKGYGNGDNGVRQGTVMATQRAMVTAMRVAGDEEGNGNKEGNGNSDEGSRQ